MPLCRQTAYCFLNPQNLSAMLFGQDLLVNVLQRMYIFIKTLFDKPLRLPTLTGHQTELSQPRKHIDLG
jgi:hypothetical protein